MIMEIAYSRTVNYSLSLDEKQGRSLRKHLGITKKQMVRLLDPTADDESEIEIEHLEYSE